jgi:2-keto-4-pentenoate hydratase/2-oxohepta-3-ene-1,7-dioic acid hydratase in catechol pathway
MKLCRFGENRYGVVRDGQVYDVTEQVANAVVAAPLQRGDAAIANLAAIVRLVEGAKLGPPAGAANNTKFLAPVINPTKIVCAPVNYEAHITESEADPGITFNHAVARIDKAGLFLKASSALVGPSEGVAVRFSDRRTDHEIELGVVIARECRNVSEKEALDVVAGYAIALDMTVRGTEDRSFRKSIDSYAVLGPWLVTPDELREPDSVDFSLKVNGEVRQQSNTRHLIFKTRKLIAWASNWYTLYPGDIIMTGTPEGVSPVAPGDVIDCEMQYIGSMRVDVRAAAVYTSDSHASEVLVG